jgi:hypothetical protein
MRPLSGVLALSLFTAAACCEAGATEVHGAAAPGGNVVEFDVVAVAAPSSLPGLCAVSAVAGKVWQGSTYHPGQLLMLSVPCGEYGLIPANAHFNGLLPVNVHSLQQSSHGIARLSDTGALLWQDGGGRNYGVWGQVAGYRVLDARMLPAMRS